MPDDPETPKRKPIDPTPAMCERLVKAIQQQEALKKTDDKYLLWLLLQSPYWLNVTVLTLDDALFTEIERRLYPEYDGEKITHEVWGWRTPAGDIRYVEEPLPVTADESAEKQD